MISRTEIESILHSKLTNVERIDENVYRGTRNYREKPYAVFYVDVSGDIEMRAKSLTEYQDRLLGRDFFKEPNDIRWNSYLLFVAEKLIFEKESFKRARSTLESDRNYARKYVIPDDQLAATLDSRLPNEKHAEPPSQDILQQWGELLTGVGAQGVLDDTEITTLVRKITNRTIENVPAAPKAPTPQDPEDRAIASHFIDRLEIRKFREYPKTHTFKFGRVNLIFGVNGVGKTTLLEAIEYFYCGSNRRCALPDDPHVICTLSNSGGRFETSNAITQKRFRERHLQWYGKLDLKRNLIFDSFASFNFLNTDAAVILATDSNPKNVQQNLATLLVGAEASRVWERVIRVQRDLRPQVKALEDQAQAAQAKIEAANDRLNNARTVVHKSDEIFTLLGGMLQSIGWKRLPVNKTIASDGSATPIVRAETAIRSITVLPEVPANLTTSTLKADQAATAALLDQANKLASENSSSRLILQRMEKRHYDCLRVQDKYVQLERYVSAGYLELQDGITRIQNDKVSLLRMAGGIEPTLQGDEHLQSSLTIAQQMKTLVSQEHSLLETVTAAKRLLDAFEESQSRNARLIQQLRATASEIIRDSVNKDKCPLCHTELAPGELQGHILAEVEQAHERSNQDAHKSWNDAQLGLARNRTAIARIRQFVDFCSGRGLNIEETSFQEAREHLIAVRKQLDDLQDEMNGMQSRLTSLQQAELSSEKFESLIKELFVRETGKIDRALIEAKAREFYTVTKELEESIARYKQEVEIMESRILEFAQAAGVKNQVDIDEIVKEINRRNNILILTIGSLTEVQELVTISPESNIYSLQSNLSDISGVQQQLQQAISLEASSDKALEEAMLAAQGAQNELAASKESLAHVVRVMTALNDIVRNHSLESATMSLLGDNRQYITNVFSRIHSPYEFEVKIEDESFLQRIANEKSTLLDEISTGQRAAFALSVFLAMNAFASKAPPVILIDDPVAHVDDLNTLSFLDYLRDLATMGTRQIFFATADDKLAGLFEHKFSFMGEQFQKFPLERK